MDTPLEDTGTQLKRMKRKYENALRYHESSLPLVGHNLLAEFEDCETTGVHAKSPKLTPARQSPFRSATFRSPTIGFSPTAQTQSGSSMPSRELKLKDAEIASLKATITKIENRMSAIQRDGQEAAIFHEKELSDVKMAKERETKKADELKSKLQYVIGREKNARDEVRRLEKEIQHQAIEKDEKLMQERRSRLHSSDQSQQERLQWMKKEAELQDKIMAQMSKIADLQIGCEESKAQLALQKDSSSSLGGPKSVEQLEEALQCETKKVKDLESRFADHEDNIVATRALKADLDLVPSMKSELEKLREDNDILRLNEQNTLLLEEKIRSLETKLAGVDSLKNKTEELEFENEELKGRLFRWEAADTSGSRRPQSPSSFARRLQELEATNVNLLLEQGELQTRANLCERRLEQAEAEKTGLSADLAAEKNTTSQLNDLVKRIKKKMILQSKHRDMYKDLLDSHESEVTVNFDAAKGRQVQHLEVIAQEWQEAASEAEAKVDSLSSQLTETMKKLNQAQQQLANHGGLGGGQSSQEDKDTIRQLREQLAVVENDLMTTQAEKNVLDAKIEQRHLQGDYDPTKTKIIHMLQNPHSLAQQAKQEEMGKLREDNERLKKRNHILEENGGVVEGITMQVEELDHTAPTSKEVEDLKSQLASADMRVQRLKEVFAKTSKEFREVVYQLTGYRFDMPCSNQYRLTSMYAEKKQDYLLFNQNGQGKIQMLQTDFSMTFEDAMENYLQKLNSLPLFLSNITMDLFNRQTIALG